MGNEQSSEIAATQSSLVTLASDDGDYQADPVVISTDGAHRSKREARRQLKESLFGISVDEISPGTHSKESSVDCLPSSPARSTGSSPKTTSATPKNGRRPNVREVAAILEDLRRTTTSEDLEILQKALRPLQEDSSRQSKPGSPSDKLAAIVTRRSSLFGATPGTATRRNTLLKKHPPSQKARRHKPQTWNPDMFVPSPLATIASLNSPKPEVKTDNPRSATPCSFNYPQLGVHELGSLRVINGAASPQPSVSSKLTALSIDNSSKGSECHSAFQSPIADASPRQKAAKNVSPSTSSNRSGSEPQETPTEKRGAWRPDMMGVSRQNTPCSPGAEMCNPRLSNTVEGFPEFHPAPTYLYSTEASSNPFLPIPSSTHHIHSFPARELPHSVNGNPEQPSAEDVDPRQAVDDDESIYSNRSIFFNPRHSRQASRTKALEALNGNSTGSSSYTLRSTDLSSSECDHTEPQTSRKPSDRYNTDYLTTHGNDKSGPGAARGGDGRMQQTNHMSNTSNFEQQRPSDRGLEPTAQPHPPFTHAPINIFSPSDPIKKVEDSDDNSQSAVNERPEVSSSPPTPEMAVPNTPEKRKGEVKSQPKKLVKKRATSERNLRASIIIQGQSGLGTIPVVPTDVAAKHSERMSKNPKMEHLEHTYDSVSTCDTRPTSPTIEPSQRVEIRFPSPTPSPEDSPSSKRGRKSKNRRSIGPSSSPHSLFRRKSSRSGERHQNPSGFREEDLQFTGVADFGTVAESLGSSPYDAAMRGFGDSRTRHNSAMAAHPHQISNMLARPKSMVGMDEKSASEWALRRSKDRLMQLETEPTTQSRQELSSWASSGVGGPPLNSYWTGVPPLSPPHTEQWNFKPRTMYQPAKPQMDPSSHATPPRVDNSSTALHQNSGSPGRKLPRSESQEEAIDPSWQAQAKLWRQQRKSIGEGLRAENSARSRENSPPKCTGPNFTAANTGDSPQRHETTPATPTESAPLFLTPLMSATDLSRPPQRQESPRKTPSPMVRQRAAYFEGEAAKQRGESRSPSPMRRVVPVERS